MSSGLIREIGKFGELQGQCGWVTEAKEWASGVGLEWVRIRIPCRQFRVTRGVYHEKEQGYFAFWKEAERQGENDNG